MVSAIKERTRRYAARHPSLFFGIYSARPRYRDLLVDRNTQVVIEGFPRSGNTFAVWAFREAQGERDVRVAHHLHAPAQIIRAAELGVPALVLIRAPEDAALSLMLRDPRFSARSALGYYASFYESVAHYRDSFVLGLFEEVVRDYGAVIELVNDRFGTDFRPFEHTEENVARVFSLIEEAHRAKRRDVVREDQIAIPSDAKARLKDALRGELRSPELAPLLTRSRAAYESLTSTGG
jgi:hypothetical protein